MNANLRLVFVLWIAASIHQFCPGTAHGQLGSPIAANPSVEEFLVEHQLSRLLLTHREMQASIATGDRTAAIDRLQRAYATELFKVITDVTWANQVLNRAKMSLAANPVRQSPRLRLAVAHREVELMQLAILNGDRVSQVDLMINDLNLIQRGVKQQVDDLERMRELEQSSLGDEVRLREQQQLLGHGEYLLGWSYFLLSTSKQHQDKQILRDAESSFRSYLELAPYLNLKKFSADKFGKENRFQRSATLGLAVVMQAIGSDPQAEHCFAIAEAHAKTASHSQREIETIDRWKVIGLLNQGDLPAAKAMLTDGPERLEDAVILNAILKRTDAGPELTSLAMIELALSAQPDRLRQSIERSPDAFASLATDLQLWIGGYLAWDDYQNEGDPQRLERAADSLQAAEKKFCETERLAIRGHCLFLLASCNFEEGSYFAATKQFLSATKLLQSNAPDLAAEAAFRAFKSARLVPKNQSQISEDIAIGLINNFPRSIFAQLAKLELTLDQLKGYSNLDAIGYLSRYRTNRAGKWSEAVVSAATVEMARRYKSSTDETMQSFREFSNAINSDSRVNNRSKIETNYFFLNALLDRSNSANFETEIEGVLSELKLLLDHPESKRIKKQEQDRYIYYQLLALRRLHPEDHPRAFAFFQQLRSLNSPSSWTIAATTEVAKFYEDVDDLIVVSEPALRQKMIEVYQALQTLLQSTSSTNREAVELKLATIYLADGKIDAANDLAINASQNASWLPILAAIAESQGDLQRSESWWQQREQLLIDGSEDWWESRLNRLKVLHQIDAEKAKAMLERTTSLYPETPQSVLGQLQELARRWRAE